MAPTKRARPAFSPPRPRKSKPSTSKPKSTSKASTSSTSTKKKRSRPSKPFTSTSKRPRRAYLLSSVSADPSDPSEDAASQESDPDSSNSEPNSFPVRRSPSPDHVLVELLPPSPTTSSSETSISPQLLHHILTQHFSRPEKTKISEDARALLGRYVDTFVREGIMRCAFERGEIDQDSGGGDMGKGVGTKGWLEVGDLERVGVQLVLDF